MKKTRESLSLGRFLLRVLRGFRQNQGLLLAGAVAYYTLLSLVPLMILLLVVLSHIVNRETLFRTVSAHLAMIVPEYATMLTAQVRTFLDHGHVVGAVGFAILLFFSSAAFTVLENAMSVIFFHRVRIRRRHFLISAVIPYLFILLLGIGALLVSFIAGALQVVEKDSLILFGQVVYLKGASIGALYMLGVGGEILMLTAFYMVMPVGGITFRHALMGGTTATVLWEITRRGLVVLVTIEVAAIILLFGAQVIAEFERSRGILTDSRATGFETGPDKGGS
jgi:membrane protein